MRIKKYQKIICLGLALLSIMVLPCYANSFNVTGLSQTNSYNFEKNDVSEVFPNKIISENGNNVFIKYTYIAPVDDPASLNIDRIRLFSSSSYYFALFHNDLSVICNDVVLNPIDEINIKIEDSDENYKLYIYYANSKNVPIITNVNYYKAGEYYEGLPVWNVIYIIDYVQAAVINITTYTNLLIQNFGKAFSFMTGPALPWVLLGITVSLITFGIHISKRIL